MRPAPRPPYCLGQAMPTQPAVCMVFCHARRCSKVSRSGATRSSLASSTQRSSGRCASNQLRTSARKVSCSGVYWKSMAHPSLEMLKRRNRNDEEESEKRRRGETEKSKKRFLFPDSPIPASLVPWFLLCWFCGSPILRLPDSWLPDPGEHLLPQPLH